MQGRAPTVPHFGKGLLSGSSAKSLAPGHGSTYVRFGAHDCRLPQSPLCGEYRVSPFTREPTKGSLTCWDRAGDALSIIGEMNNRRLLSISASPHTAREIPSCLSQIERTAPRCSITSCGARSARHSFSWSGRGKRVTPGAAAFPHWGVCKQGNNRAGLEIHVAGFRIIRR